MRIPLYQGICNIYSGLSTKKTNSTYYVHVYECKFIFISLCWQFFTFHTDTDVASTSKSSGVTADSSQSSGGATQKSPSPIGKSLMCHVLCTVCKSV